MFPQGVALILITAFGADAEEEVFLCGGDACFFKQGGNGVRHARVSIDGGLAVVEDLSRVSRPAQSTGGASVP